MIKRTLNRATASIQDVSKDGDDVPLYLEKHLAKLLAELEGLGEDENS